MLWRMTFIFMSRHERRVYRYFSSVPHGDEFGIMSAGFANVLRSAQKLKQ